MMNNNMIYSDRFIPSRVSTDLESLLSNTTMSSVENSSAEATIVSNNPVAKSPSNSSSGNALAKQAFNTLLRNELLHHNDPSVAGEAYNSCIGEVDSFMMRNLSEFSKYKESLSSSANTTASGTSSIETIATSVHAIETPSSPVASQLQALPTIPYDATPPFRSKTRIRLSSSPLDRNHNGSPATSIFSYKTRKTKVGDVYSNFLNAYDENAAVAEYGSYSGMPSRRSSLGSGAHRESVLEQLSGSGSTGVGLGLSTVDTSTNSNSAWSAARDASGLISEDPTILGSMLPPSYNHHGSNSGPSEAHSPMFAYNHVNTRNPRKIPKSAFKVLDAPLLQDDYYLNLLDWSHQNILAVGLGSTVFLWSGYTSKVTQLCDLGTRAVTSIAWTNEGDYLAIGTSAGDVEIWDPKTGGGMKVRDMASHSGRVGTLAWYDSLLATGSRDRAVFLQDTRIRSVTSGNDSTNSSTNSSTSVNSSNRSRIRRKLVRNSADYTPIRSTGSIPGHAGLDTERSGHTGIVSPFPAMNNEATDSLERLIPEIGLDRDFEREEFPMSPTMGLEAHSIYPYEERTSWEKDNRINHTNSSEKATGTKSSVGSGSLFDVSLNGKPPAVPSTPSRPLSHSSISRSSSNNVPSPNHRPVPLPIWNLSQSATSTKGTSMSVLNSPGSMGRILNTVNQSIHSPARIVSESSRNRALTGSGGGTPKTPLTPTILRSPFKNGKNSMGMSGSVEHRERCMGMYMGDGSRDACVVHKLIAHKQEVCGLKISPSGRQIATGGNDNKLCIWDIASATRVARSHRVPANTQCNSGMGRSGHSLGSQAISGVDDDFSSHNSSRGGINQISDVDSNSTLCPIFKFHDHVAAVKAVAWSPHQVGVLASGGGTADRNIRYWNTHTGECIGAYDTGSQVCNLVWSTSVNELVSTHGYSLNQIIVWKYPTMTRLATLHGHTSRYVVICICLLHSPFDSTYF